MILQQHKIVFAGSMGAGKTEAIRSLYYLLKPLIPTNKATIKWKQQSV